MPCCRACARKKTCCGGSTNQMRRSNPHPYHRARMQVETVPLSYFGRGLNGGRRISAKNTKKLNTLVRAYLLYKKK